MEGTVELKIESLGDKFKDYRVDIAGDSFTFGPVLQADKVKYFSFHHSVTKQTAKDDGNWQAECDQIAQDHLVRRQEGYTGVGYRFIICSDGTVAYVGDLSHGGAAIRYHTDEVISACMVGDFTKELPTDAQIISAHLLADHFVNHMPQYPLIDSWDKVIGHKDAAAIFKDVSLATACPGSSWPNDMKYRIQHEVIYAPQAPADKDPETLKQIEDLKLQIENMKKIHAEELSKVKVQAVTEVVNTIAAALDKMKQPQQTP